MYHIIYVMNEEVLEKNNVNAGRQIEIDWIKMFAIIIMVICHVYEEISLPASGSFKYICEFLFAMCAPIFMFAMGIGIIYSKNSNPKSMAIRGIKLFLLGYILNILRYVIALPFLDQVDYSVGWSIQDIIFNVDILHFAGLSILLIAIMKKIRLKYWQMLIVAIIMQIIGQLLSIIPLAAKFEEYIFGLFIYTSKISNFPLLLWIFYPIVGILFGERLQHISNKDKFYKKIFIIGMFVMIAALVFMHLTKIDIKIVFELKDDNFYKQTILHYIFMLSEIFMLISSFYFISKKVKNRYIVSYVEYNGTNLNLIYIIQWIIIGNFSVFMENGIEQNLIIPIGVLLFIISIAISKVYLSFRNERGKTII